MGLVVNRCYITPVLSDGTVQEQDSETTFTTARGVFTLAAGTYFFPLPIGGASIFDAHLTHDAAIAAVATIETCSHGRSEVSDVSVVAGEWMDQDPTTAYVATVGATTTATNGVVTIVAGNAGGADWQVSGCAAARARLKVAVTTPGEVRLSFCGKD